MTDISSADSSTPVSLSDASLTPQQGQWYQLLQDYGSGVGMLTATVTVNGVDVPRQFRLVDVYEPGTPGIGALDEESPVVLWLETTSTGVVGAHTVQFRMDAFLQLFTTGAEPPEWAEFVAQNSIGA